MPIRIAAIGVGHWHTIHDAAYLKTLARMPEVELVGLQDADREIASARAAQFGNAPVFTNYRDMLAAVKPDFVLVLGRPDEMAATAHDLLDAGLPFLVEKPAGLNAREVRGVADKAAATKTFVGVPFFHRYHPFVAHARSMLDAGAFGPVSHFRFRSTRGSPARYVAWGAPWMLDPQVAGGGCLRNIGLHGLDLFAHLFGSDAQVCGAQTSSRAHNAAIEDHAVVLLRSADGIAGIVEAAYTYPGAGAEAEWQLAGRDALLVMRAGAVRCITASGETELAAAPAEPLAALALRDALARWQQGEAPVSGIADCSHVMRLADEAYALAAPNAAR